MSLDFNTVRRLAYIRYLHRLGIEQARFPEPLSSASVLMFHDAVESFLLLAAEHLGANPPREFEQYWAALSPEKLGRHGVQLALKQGMARLNRVRVTLKHHGGHPDGATIEQIKDDTASFMSANANIVFHVDYDAVSMAEVVPQPSVREKIKSAEAESANGDRIGGMIALSEALGELFAAHSEDAGGRGSSPFLFGPTLRNPMSAHDISALLHLPEGLPWRWRPTRGEDNLATQLVEMADILGELQNATRITALGIDFAAYQRFRSLTPARSETYYQREYRAPQGYAPTEDDFAFCYEFVVSTALRLAAVEAHLTQPQWIDPQKSPWQIEWETIRQVPVDR